MELSQLLNTDKVTLSFEVFPPSKAVDADNVKMAVKEIASTSPDFMSVTYGAAGGASALSAQLAQHVQSCGVDALAHLTCVGTDKESIKAQLDDLKARGIKHVLALRGDLQEGQAISEGQYRHASQLVEQLREVGGFCIGGACHPEGHTESTSQKEDLKYLKQKVDKGCDFLVSQMVFDNSALYSFLYRAEREGIHLPVIAGVMPVTNSRQIKRICELSGATLPNRFRMILDRFGHDPKAMKQAGIAYATEQIVDLIANGVKGVHVYTMNKPDVARQISNNLSDILK